MHHAIHYAHLADFSIRAYQGTLKNMNVGFAVWICGCLPDILLA